MVEVCSERPDRYKILWDEAHGAVLVEQCGFWSVEDGEACSRDLAPQLARSRARHGGGALFIVDASRTPVQAPAYTEKAPQTIKTTLSPRDRIAVVVQSSLAKMQMQRIPQAEAAHGYFISRSAAETWLYAHSGERRAS